MENLKEDKLRLKNYIKKYKRKRDYEGLFAITQIIISERKKTLERKIDNYMEEGKQYANQTEIFSEKDLERILFLNQQFDILSEKYDTYSKLENELQKKNIYELIIEAENQYNEYLRENDS